MARKHPSHKNTTIQTSLTQDEHDRFIGHVKAQNRTVAEVLREAVTFYLDEYDKRKLCSLDYDDPSEERRLPRYLWGG